MSMFAVSSSPLLPLCSVSVGIGLTLLSLAIEFNWPDRLAFVMLFVANGMVRSDPCRRMQLSGARAEVFKLI